eukprot:5626886-Prymnesium_polylepis.1
MSLRISTTCEPCTLYPLCGHAPVLGVNVSAPFSAVRVFTWRALVWGWLHAPSTLFALVCSRLACCRPGSAERARA